MRSSLAREEAEGAFERLYRSHRADVYRFVLRDVRNPDEAEDVTQTAFLNALRAFQHGDRPEKPRAWLLTIAQNVSRKRFRTRSSRPQEVELDPEVFVAPEREGPSAGEIREALMRLRPNHRAAIVLREIGGLSYAEIAETLSLSVSAVETLLFRARRALREELTAERGLRVGGLVILLPPAASHAFGSLAAWFGRRAATLQLAGAFGAAAVGVGVAVQTGALALARPEAESSIAEVQPAAGPLARDAPEARPRPARVEREKASETSRASKTAKTAKTAKASGASNAPNVTGSAEQPGGDAEPSGGSLPAIEAPTLTLPTLEVPSASLPDAEIPEVEAPALPLPEVEPPLPDADDVAP
jgi:RNA polymerase sigma-70 factor (ECF subfamily)